MDAAQIAAMVLGPACWSAERITGRGIVNGVFAVRSPQTEAVVRFRPEDRAEAEYRKEAWCIANSGVPGPKVLAVGRHRGVPYMVETLVPGVPGAPTAAVWRQLGAFARRIHRVPATGFGEDLADPDRGRFTAPLHPGFDGTWEGFVRYNIEALAPEDPLLRLGILTPARSRSARASLETLRGRTWRFGLVHGDLHPSNTLVDGGGDLRLLDWGSARVDVVPHGEIVQLLRGGIDAWGLRAFMKGYGQNMPADIRAHLLLRLLDTCRWALDRAPSRLGDCAAQLRRALDLP